MAILIFFGADKIPEFARMMGKGVREFKKATDDIKREFSESSAGIVNEVRSLGNDVMAVRDDMTDTLNREISETAKEAEKTFDGYNSDYYYENPDDMGYYGSEYQKDTNTSDSVAEKTAEIPVEATDIQQPEIEPVAATKPKSKSKPKPKSASKPKPKSKPAVDTPKLNEA